MKLTRPANREEAIATQAAAAERLRIANALHRLGTQEAHLHAGMIEKNDLQTPEDRPPPITGAEFVEAIHVAIPDAFSDLDDVLEPR